MTNLSLTAEIVESNRAREATSNGGVYPLLMVFVRSHTKGPCKGLTTIGTLRFVSHASALSWLAGVAKYAVRNGYRVTEHAIVAF